MVSGRSSSEAAQLLLGEKNDENLHSTRGQYHHRRSFIRSNLINILLLVSSMPFFAAGIISFEEGRRFRKEGAAIAAVPALEEAAQSYSTRHLIGRVGEPTPFKGPISLAVEQLWKSQTNDQILQISHEELIRAGGSDISVQIPAHLGGGYMASLELDHNIHCLFMLWKHTHPAYSNATALGADDPSSELRIHLDHCADILRQLLLCQADTTLLTYNWRTRLGTPTPNFNTPHTCRDVDRMYEWYEGKRLRLTDEEKEEVLRKPKGVVEVDGWP